MVTLHFLEAVFLPTESQPGSREVCYRLDHQRPMENPGRGAWGVSGWLSFPPCGKSQQDGEKQRGLGHLVGSVPKKVQNLRVDGSPNARLGNGDLQKLSSCSGGGCGGASAQSAHCHSAHCSAPFFCYCLLLLLRVPPPCSYFSHSTPLCFPIAWHSSGLTVQTQ